MTDRTRVSSKWLAPLIAALVATLVLFAWNKFQPLSVESPKPVSRVDKSGLNRIYYGPANSIAVLSFGGDPALSAQFSVGDGFSRELQRSLTRVPALRVTALTSSHFFRDDSVPLRLIAERLQVSHLLSGEFESSEGKMRVKVHLMNAKRDKELWSERYERNLDDVFSLQDEILFSVVNAIRPGAADSVAKVRAVEIEAWLLYLEALSSYAERTPEGLLFSVQAFRAALDIEPDYVLARVGLARSLLAMGAGSDQQAALLEEARSLLRGVLESDPEQADALGLLSYISHHFDWNWRDSLEQAEKALGQRSGDPELMSIASLALSSLGQFDRAVALLDSAVRQDPINLARRMRLGLLQEFAQDYEQSLASYRQVLGSNPEVPGAWAYRARVKIIQEKPDSAMEQSEKEVDPFWKQYSRILALTALERHEEAVSLLELMIEEKGDHAAYQIAEILAFRGDTDSAFDWLVRAMEQKDGGMASLVGNFFLLSLHPDPRWAALIEQMGIPLVEFSTP